MKFSVFHMSRLWCPLLPFKLRKPVAIGLRKSSLHKMKITWSRAKERVEHARSTCNSHDSFHGKNIRSYFSYNFSNCNVLYIKSYVRNILLSSKNLGITKTQLRIGEKDDAKLQNCMNAHVAAWKGAKYEANLFILNNGSKWTILYRMKRANNWEATGTEEHQSLVRSFSSFPCQLITLLRG